MAERTYSNFDLVIEKSGDKYCARVIASPSGQARAEFDTPFSSLELENFVLRMGRPKRGMRRLDSPEMETVKRFGTRLFQTVFNDDVYACYLRSVDNVLIQGSGLRVRLHINVPEFHNLPWEYLYNPQVDQFLALSKDTPIIRYVELPYTTQALPVDPPLKILVMISSPDGYPQLNIEEEWKRLNKALQPLSNYGLVTLEKLEYPTLTALQQKLRKDQIHIFHFIGHGKYFEQKQDGLLLLEDENHRGRPISGQHLGAILHDHHTLRLVILNACEGARTSSEDPYAGVAQTLVRQGIPAVLAMQFEIFEDAALTFAHEFYSALVDNYPVDAALSEARKAIFATGNDVEWGTPVLFTRAADGVLFKRIHYVGGYDLDRKLAREESGFKATEFGPKEKVEQSSNKKIEAIRIAREREQLERQQQQSKSVASAAANKIVAESKPRTQTAPRWMFILGGISLLLLLFTLGVKAFWPVVPQPTPTDVSNARTMESSAVLSLSTPTTFIPTPSKIPTSFSTSTYVPLIITTIPSLAPIDPAEFLVFYFDIVILQDDLEKGWSLLTPAYQNGKAAGWESYSTYWARAERWEYSKLQVEYNNNQRARVLLTFTIYYNDGSKPSPLEDMRYCLLWEKNINTWKIDERENCP